MARFEQLLTLVLVVTMAGGLGLLAGGARPREVLHFVYAAIAVGAVPVADSLSRHGDPRRRGIATCVGALVALVVILRLFGTG
jgi:Flp pilus assembly protein protease CpaA